MNKRFDFTEIDEALPDAEKMQEKDLVTETLENNYEAVRILGANVEKLENRLSETMPRMEGVVSSLREASTVSVSEDARKTLEQEGDKICRKMANSQFMHSLMLWKILGYTAAFLALCIVLTIFTCRKLKQ